VRFPSILVPALLLLGCAAREARNFSPPETSSPKKTYRFLFRGNENLSDSDLLGVLKKLEYLPPRKGITPAFLADTAFDLQEHYKESGFPEARVQGFPLGRPPGGAVYKIHEGPLVTLGRIRVEGAGAFPEERLVELLRPPVPTFLSFPVGRPLFSESSLQAWRDRVKELYERAGFFDVRVSPPEVERKPGGNRANVTLRIRENRRYKVGRTLLRGDTRALSPGLKKDFAGLRGSWAAPRMDTLWRARILDELSRKGHARARVRVKMEKDPDKGLVTLAADVRAGPVARVTSIRLEGLRRTRPSHVEGKLKIHPGQILDSSKVEESLDSFYRTGLFELVKVRKDLSRDGKEARLTFLFQEAPSRDIWFLAGGGTYEGPRVGLGFTDRNLFGTGKLLALKTKLSPRVISFQQGLTDPDFLEEGQVLSFRTEESTRRRASFTSSIFGTELSLTRPLGSWARIRLSDAFRMTNETNARGDAAAEAGRSKVALAGLSFVYDSRDQVLFPSKGTFIQGGLEVASPALGGNVNFTRWRFSASKVLPLGRGFFLAGRAGTTLVFPWGDRPLPLSEKVFMGGESSVRSFKQDRLGPRDAKGYPLGGQYGNILSLELRYPLTGPLRGAFFWDAGNVGRDADEWTLAHLKHGIGAGLRYFLPIGPIRLDWAWNPRRGAREARWALQFSLGYPF